MLRSSLLLAAMLVLPGADARAQLSEWVSPPNGSTYNGGDAIVWQVRFPAQDGDWFLDDTSFNCELVETAMGIPIATPPGVENWEAPSDTYLFRDDPGMGSVYPANPGKLKKYKLQISCVYRNFITGQSKNVYSFRSVNVQD